MGCPVPRATSPFRLSHIVPESSASNKSSTGSLSSSDEEFPDLSLPDISYVPDKNEFHHRVGDKRGEFLLDDVVSEYAHKTGRRPERLKPRLHPRLDRSSVPSYKRRSLRSTGLRNQECQGRPLRSIELPKQDFEFRFTSCGRPDYDIEDRVLWKPRPAESSPLFQTAQVGSEDIKLIIESGDYKVSRSPSTILVRVPKYKSLRSIAALLYSELILVGPRYIIIENRLPNTSERTVSATLMKLLPREFRYRLVKANGVKRVHRDAALAALVQGFADSPIYEACVGGRLQDFECISFPIYTYSDPLRENLDVIQNIQQILNKFYDDVNWSVRGFHSMLIEIEDFEIPAIENAKIDFSRRVVKSTMYDKIKSTLHAAGLPEPFDHTQRQLLLAYLKRNAAVPSVQGNVDIVETADTMIYRFLTRCTIVIPVYDGDELMKEGYFPPIALNAEAISNWLDTQDFSDTSIIVGERPLSEERLDHYKIIGKRERKPELKHDAGIKVPSTQTIVFSTKVVNACAGPIFNEIRRRIISVLRDNIIIMSDMSTADFELRLSKLDKSKPFALFVGDDVLIWDGGRFIEYDFSKYDKSQGLLALYYNCQLSRLFGAPEDFVHLWFGSLIETHIKDTRLGFSVVNHYQMKSGIASTLIDNTKFLMGVISFFMDLPRLNPYCDLPTEHEIGINFNLEVKRLIYKVPYFCSKFIVDQGSGMRVVPDPLKLATRLSRCTLVNPMHKEMYRLSVIEQTMNYNDLVIQEAVSYGMAERYEVNWGVPLLMKSLYSVCRIPKEWDKIFPLDPKAKYDVSRVVVDS